MSIRKHTAYNLFGAVIPIAVALVTIPIYIDVVGEARYGVLAIAWLLLGYFGLFDLGLGRATAQRIALLTNGEPGERSDTFWTALAINSALGLVGMFIMWPVALYIFSNHFSIESALQPEILNSVVWLALAVPVATISGVLSGTLQGLSKFLELNVISVTGSALLQIVPLAIAIIHGPDLTWLIPATIVTRVFIAVVLFQRCHIHILAGRGIKVSKALSGRLLQFGGWVTVSSVIGPMMVILDRFLIGAQLGARYVTYYTVPFQLVERTNVIPNALSSALFPRLAHTRLSEGGRTLADKALKSLIIVITPMFLLGVLFMDWFLNLWIDEAFAAQASLAGQILFLGFWGNAIAKIPHALLQASGKPEIVAKCHLVELIPYIILLYFGLEYFGIVGAAIAFSVRAIADSVILLYCANVSKQVLKFLLIPAILMIVALILVNADYSSLVLTSAGAILFSVCLCWAFINIPEELASLLKTYLPKIIS